MNYILTIIFLTSFSINKDEIEIKYHFENQCGKEISRDSISFELQDPETMESYYSENLKVKIPKYGKYELFVWITDGELEKSFEETVEITNSSSLNDTIRIPKILYISEKMNKDWEYDNEFEPKYYNCQKICEGYQIDYFKNGKKRVEGKFKNGNPIWMSEYQRDGAYIKYYYDKFDRWYKWEYFDQEGNLTKYLENTFRKKNWIQKTYDSKGKLVEKEVKIYYPLKN